MGCGLASVWTCGWECVHRTAAQSTWTCTCGHQIQTQGEMTWRHRTQGLNHLGMTWDTQTYSHGQQTDSHTPGQPETDAEILSDLDKVD